MQRAQHLMIVRTAEKYVGRDFSDARNERIRIERSYFCSAIHQEIRPVRRCWRWVGIQRPLACNSSQNRTSPGKSASAQFGMASAARSRKLSFSMRSPDRGAPFF
jgi:hypothetical protein